MELKFKKEFETEVFVTEIGEIAIIQKNAHDEDDCVILSADKALMLAEFLMNSGIVDEAREAAAEAE
jgi:hypothetical protein